MPRGVSCVAAAVGNAPAARPALEPLPSGEIRLRWAALESDVELH